jgi:hypothetical protein
VSPASKLAQIRWEKNHTEGRVTQGADLDLIPSPGWLWRLVLFGAEPFDSHIGATTEDQSDLSGVVLRVPQVVDQELSDIQLVPPEAAALLGTVLS